MRAIQIPTLGGPEVLEVVDLPEPNAGPGRVVVEVGAAGVNFIDTYHRSGLYPVQLPMVPGLEGAGRVMAVGTGVGDLTVGDRVAWADCVGSYSELVSLRAERAIKVPDDVPTDQAAAVMLQGITAHYLATSTFPLQAGHRCLIHAGAGGVGRLLIQIAKHFGAEVFATVGSPVKATLAESAGADHVISYREIPFTEAVEAVAGERPLDVVFDGIGQSTFAAGLTLLKPRGTMVTFGNASGPVEAVSPLELSRNGSLFLTRPTMGDHISERWELEQRTTDLMGWIADATLDVHIGARYPLEEASNAHSALEGRLTTGKVLLTP
ncbi:quinone oxidoreductase [soil metagenome]